MSLTDDAPAIVLKLIIVIFSCHLGKEHILTW